VVSGINHGANSSINVIYSVHRQPLPSK
jgi:broad specificity polyphosphatase/5'/3'-nucleotidase SurE